ncbi:flavin reductase family protein [Frankia tisae]|uniref:flavin reductase family protein n=1 Tax=Frankia tisae TaxID=2950104 RepID=UPI0021BED84C|nr:flavin reductase family protein [Frankia tisae]
MTAQSTAARADRADRTGPGEQPESPATLVDSATFRDVLSHFATGVVIVTAMAGDRPVGLTCQSFTALSLDPPMILFCPARTSTSWPVLAACGRLCVNILSADQHEISNGFARSGADKFAGVAWTPLPNGAPALERAAAHIGASLAEVHDGGDHHIVTCHVESLRAGEGGAPLLYYRSEYRHLRPQD